MRADRVLAFASFLLALTALWLPWWRMAWDDGSVTSGQDFWAFRPQPPITGVLAPWVTGLLVAAAALLLFVRLAANSERHEPPSWRRDLGIAAGLLAVAAASLMLWRNGPPGIWGSESYPIAAGNATSGTETLRMMPALGWWCDVVATACAVVAAIKARTIDNIGPDA